MDRKQLIKELKFIFTRAVFLDISAYLISVIFTGFTISVALGLLLGTFGLLVNFILLNRSVRSIVNGGGIKAQQRMLGGYITRYAVVAVIVAVSALLPFVSIVGTVIPYIYPQLIYAGQVFLKKGD